MQCLHIYTKSHIIVMIPSVDAIAYVPGLMCVAPVVHASYLGDHVYLGSRRANQRGEWCLTTKEVSTDRPLRHSLKVLDTISVSRGVAMILPPMGAGVGR